MGRYRSVVAGTAAALLLIAAGCVPSPPKLPDPVISCESFDVSVTYSPPPTTVAGDTIATVTAGSGLSDCTDHTGRGITGGSMDGQFDLQNVCAVHPEGAVLGTGIGAITWSNGLVTRWKGEAVKEGGITLRLELTSGKFRGSTAVVPMTTVGGSGDCDAGITEQQFGNVTPFVLHAPGAPVRPPLTGASEVVAGGYHACAITSEATLACWGQNVDGQLGNGGATPPLLGGQPYATEVVGLSGVTAATAGERHTCAVAVGELSCWGANEAGQLGDGTDEDRHTPTVVDLSGVVAVSAGADSTCALLSDGTVQCWGANASTEPTPVAGLSGVSTLAVGGYLTGTWGRHACAIVGVDTVQCWGRNADGELGNGTNVTSPSPVDVLGVSAPTDVAAGVFGTSCAVDGGQVRCWGRNEFGQLGDGTTDASDVPVPASGATDAVDVGAGAVHTCARFDDGGVRCWGNNDYGQLGDGTTTQRTAPAAVTGLGGPASDLAVGHYFTCAVVGGGVRCWGANGGSALGNGTVVGQSATPTDVVVSP